MKGVNKITKLGIFKALLDYNINTGEVTIDLPKVDESAIGMIEQFPYDVQQKLIRLTSEEVSAFSNLPPDTQMVLAQQKLDDIRYFLDNERNQML